MSSSDDNYWQEDPEFPHADWQYEVSSGYTLQGYHDWVAGQRELQEEDDG